MYTSLKERFKKVKPYEYFLYLSSHFFVLPVFLSIYMNRYDVLWIFTSILWTSLLRWGNNDVVLYQYIDHNWVKFIFLYMIISFFDAMMEGHMNAYESIYLFGILASILLLFIIEQIFFILSNNPVLSITIHMILHFYTTIGGIVALHIDHDFSRTLRLFPSTFRFMYDVLWGTVKMILPATIVASLSRE